MIVMHVFELSVSCARACEGGSVCPLKNASARLLIQRLSGFDWMHVRLRICSHAPVCTMHVH